MIHFMNTALLLSARPHSEKYVLFVAADHLHDASVHVSRYLPTHSTPGASELCAQLRGPFESGETRHVICMQDVVGRYVIISLPGNEEVLTLCEVQVYGVRGTATIGDGWTGGRAGGRVESGRGRGREGGRAGGREGGRAGGWAREREGERAEGMEGGWAGWREGGRAGRRQGGRAAGRQGGRAAGRESGRAEFYVTRPTSAVTIS